MPALPRVDDETLEEEADEEVIDVACVACGTTDAKAFSHRMIKRRGRHGDRTRRCLACVASGAGLATDQSASGVAFAAPDAAATGQARAASSAWTAAPRKRPAEEAVAPHGLQTRHEIRAAKAQRKLQRRQRGGFGKHLESAGPEGHATPMGWGQTTV